MPNAKLERMSEDEYVAPKLSHDAHTQKVDNLTLLTKLKALNQAGISTRFQSRIDDIAIPQALDFLRRSGVTPEHTADKAESFLAPSDNPLNWHNSPTISISSWDLAGQATLPRSERDNYSATLYETFEVQNPSTGRVAVSVPETVHGTRVIMGPRLLEPRDEWNYHLDPVTARVLQITSAGQFSTQMRALDKSVSRSTFDDLSELNSERNHRGLSDQEINQRIAERTTSRR